MGKLEGRVAVVTGGSSGIGLATAKRLVDEGAFVFITGRRLAQLEEAKASIGRNVAIVQGDVSKLEDIERLWATVENDKGGVDVIIASAGVVETVTLKDATPEHFDRTFGVNARGTFFTIQRALPLLRDGASIVLVASCVANMGIPVYTTYAATKAAVRSFARTWASELKDRGIRVNALSPGATDTPIIDGQFASSKEAEEAKKSFAARTPLGRIGRPDDLAAAALFLATSDSAYVTGIDLVVDGGMTQV